MESHTIQIGEMVLSLDEAQETLSAIRAGKIDGVVVEGATGSEVFTFRDPGHPYRMLVEAMSEGAVLTTLDGLISYENPCFSRLTGTSGDSMLGRPFAELVLPPRRADLEALLERVRSGVPARGDVELMGAEGRAVPVQLSVSRALLVDVDLFCIIVTDLTAQQRQEQLYRTARLEIEARDRLFSIASHELRNPLGIVELQTQLLRQLLVRSRSDSPSPIEHAIEIVDKLGAQGKRLAELVAKLLDVGSIGTGRLKLSSEPLDLAELVRGVVKRAQEAIRGSGSSITLDLQPARGAWDRVRLEQVVENLLSNALKYGGGRPIGIFVGHGKRVACLVVEDQGKGIPEEARERIFRPYERMADTAAAPGLGLGLYISSEIVKAHGGRVRVEGMPDGGSRFIVELPLQVPSG